MIKDEKAFVNFKVHTQYSICEGAIKIEDLADYCKTNKIKAIGLSDNFNLCGALEFSEAISKVGTQPIIGSQINVSYSGIIGKLPIFSKTKLGYTNLTKLSSKSYLDVKANERPHCSINDLFKNKSDLIILSGGMDSLFSNLLSKNKNKEIEEITKKLRDNFSDSFYFEIQRHGDFGEKKLENLYINLSQKYKIPLIASQEVFYLKKDMFEAHDALLCIGEKTYLDENNRKKFTDQHYLKSSEEMQKLYEDLPDALENNYHFPFRFNYKLKKSSPVLPTIKISSKLTEISGYRRKKFL